MSPGAHFDFARIAVTPPRIQRQAVISSPDDPYEREADEVADKVMQIVETVPPSELASEGKIAPAGWSPATVQQNCAGCEDKAKSKVEVARQVLPADGATGTAAPTSLPEPPTGLVPAGGRPLDESLRSWFEPRFGRNFADVRIHTDGAAAESAAALAAAAYTAGNHVVFGAGQFAPQSIAGRRLIAHELAHVAQQETGRVPTGRVSRTAENNCTPATMHVANPDGVISAGFRAAMHGVEEAISVVDTAVGATRPRWWLSRGDAAMMVNFLFNCPTDLTFVRGRLSDMRAWLATGFPYRCSTAASFCVPDSSGGRRGVVIERVLAGGGHPGFEVPRAAVVCPQDLQEQRNMIGILIAVAAELSGVPTGHLGDPRASVSYVWLSTAEGRVLALQYGERPGCDPGTGIPAPEQPTVVEQEHHEEPGPSHEPGETCQLHAVDLNDETNPTSWANVTVGARGSAAVCHAPGRPPAFVRLHGRSFNLNPDRTVTPRPSPTAGRR